MFSDICDYFVFDFGCLETISESLHVQGLVLHRRQLVYE